MSRRFEKFNPDNYVFDDPTAVDWFHDRQIKDPWTQKLVYMFTNLAQGMAVDREMRTREKSTPSQELSFICLWFLYCMWRVHDDWMEQTGMTDRKEQAKLFADDLRKYADLIDESASGEAH